MLCKEEENGKIIIISNMMPQFEPDTSERMISFVPARNTRGETKRIELELVLQFFFFSLFIHRKPSLLFLLPCLPQADVIDGHVREIERARKSE